MKKTILLALAIGTCLQWSFAQGSIDIDTNIQMGVASKEHVTITNSAFSLQDEVGQTPLIYGDFGTGNVGIGLTGLEEKLNVKGVIRIYRGSAGQNTFILNKHDPRVWSTQNGTGLSYPFTNGDLGHLVIQPRTSSPRDVLIVTGNGDDIRMAIKGDGKVGIGLTNPSQKLSVNGNASKSSAGSWVANSDARLKKEITQLDSERTLEKLLQLEGVTYQWDDDKTGIERPAGIQYGFTAQNIRDVFPSMVTEDDMGYLQSAYGNYDAMFIEAIRALKKENDELRTLYNEVRINNEELRSEIGKRAGKEEMQALRKQLNGLIRANQKPRRSESR